MIQVWECNGICPGVLMLLSKLIKCIFWFYPVKFFNLYYLWKVGEGIVYSADEAGGKARLELGFHKSCPFVFPFTL